MTWARRWLPVLRRARALMPWHGTGAHPPDYLGARIVDAFYMEGMIAVRFSEDVEYTGETPTDEHIYGAHEDRPGGPQSPMVAWFQMYSDTIGFIFDYMPVQDIFIEAGQVNLYGARGLVPPQGAHVRQ